MQKPQEQCAHTVTSPVLIPCFIFTSTPGISLSQAPFSLPDPPHPGVHGSPETDEVAEVRRQLRAAALGQSNGPSYEDKLLASLGIVLEEDGGTAWKRSAGEPRT